MCNKRSVKSVRRKAKGTHYVESVQECECVFEPHRTRRYGCLSRRPRALFASLGAAALSRTHRSPDADFTVFRLHLRSLFSSVFAPGSSSSSLPSQLLPFWRRDNETACAATALRVINLRKCIQLFVNRMF